jgi:hypothetical protein
MMYRGKLGPFAVLAAILPAQAGVAEPPSETGWRYSAVADDESLGDPVFQTVRLEKAPPENLAEKIAYRGKRQLFAQLRYGSEDSTRVTVIVDDAGDDFDLYVDADRSRSIDAKERAAGSGRARTVDLKAEVTRGDENDHYPRTVAFRRGAGGTLSVATLGYAQGHVRIGEQQLAARRVDGDANGLFSDPADRVWIDLDADGRWDSFSEQFAYLPVLRLEGRRCAVRSDRVGTRMSLEEVVGEGRATVRVARLAEGAQIARLLVMLVGDDGSAFTVRGDDPSLALPVGRYFVGSVTLSVVDGKSPDPWHFTFSRSGGQPPDRWYELHNGGEITIDPIGELRFDVQAEGPFVQGKDAIVRPQLVTQDGLFINSSTRGSKESWDTSRHNCAAIELVSRGKRLLATATSGFS